MVGALSVDQHTIQKDRGAHLLKSSIYSLKVGPPLKTINLLQRLTFYHIYQLMTTSLVPMVALKVTRIKFHGKKGFHTMNKYEGLILSSL